MWFEIKSWLVAGKNNPFTCSVLVKFIIGQKRPQKKVANESSGFYCLWESSGVVLPDRKSECMYNNNLQK